MLGPWKTQGADNYQGSPTWTQEQNGAYLRLSNDHAGNKTGWVADYTGELSPGKRLHAYGLLSADTTNGKPATLELIWWTRDAQGAFAFLKAEPLFVAERADQVTVDQLVEIPEGATDVRIDLRLWFAEGWVEARDLDLAAWQEQPGPTDPPAEPPTDPEEPPAWPPYEGPARVEIVTGGTVWVVEATEDTFTVERRQGLPTEPAEAGPVTLVSLRAEA